MIGVLRAKAQRWIATPTILFWSIFLLALALRLVFVSQWKATPYGEVPLLDAQAYDAWASDIAAGNLLRGKAFYQSPLYPYVAGLIYWLFGHSLQALGLLNALFGALAAALLARLTLTWFGPGAAIITGLLGATYRLSIFYTIPLMKEAMVLLFLVLFAAFLYRAIQKNRVRDYALSGFFLGLETLVRGNALFFAPFVLLHGFLKHRAAFKTKALAFVATLLLTLAPATVHNYLVSGDFVLVNYADGFNLYIGHWAHANGTNAYPPEVSTDPVQEEMNTIWAATRAEERPLGPAQVSAYWRERALLHIFASPWRTLRLSFDKFLAVWQGDEMFDNYDIDFVVENFGTILKFPWPRYTWLTVLAAFGAVASWQKKRTPVVFLGTLTLIYVGTLILFYVTERYRLPVIVFLLPLAGSSAPAAYDLLREKDYKRLSAALATALVFLGLSLIPSPKSDLKAYNLGILAMINEDAGHHEKALEIFEKGRAVSPIGIGTAAYIRASFAQESLGNLKEAEHLLNEAQTLFPNDGIVSYNYGRLLMILNRPEEALQAFHRGTKLSPYYLLNYYALASLLGTNGQKEKARAVTHQALTLDPTNPLLRALLEDLK